MFTLHNTCRACGSTDLIPVVDFSWQPLANDFKTADEPHAGAAPLKVLFCRRCSLAQLSVVVDPLILYHNYPYVTSTSRMMQEHFSTIITDLMAEHGGSLGNLLEIGSNDGAFLARASVNAASVCGVDPARNLCDLSRDRGINTFCSLWHTSMTGTLPWSQFDTIVARHVFCHCDDWNDFISALEFVSHDRTVVAIEVPYAGDLLAKNEFDTIYHEHLSYMSIRAMNMLLESTAFYLSRVIRYPIHGGAMLMILRKRKGGDKPVCNDDIRSEHWVNLQDQMRDMTTALRKHVKIIGGCKAYRCCGYGASAKSTLWLNACGFSGRDIEFIHDVTPQKQGKLAPGTDIPIIDGTEPLKGCTHAVLFAWNYENEILAREKELRDNGLKFIVPVPQLKVV